MRTRRHKRMVMWLLSVHSLQEMEGELTTPPYIATVALATSKRSESRIRQVTGALVSTVSDCVSIDVALAGRLMEFQSPLISCDQSRSKKSTLWRSFESCSHVWHCVHVEALVSLVVTTVGSRNPVPHWAEICSGSARSPVP
ncbi:hypothetical protein Mapa_001939 [Marchantia paleacea]|nr:hypothetical protein Mapa_001939 [Marchantia paleacea]